MKPNGRELREASCCSLTLLLRSRETRRLASLSSSHLKLRKIVYGLGAHSTFMKGASESPLLKSSVMTELLQKQY